MTQPHTPPPSPFDEPSHGPTEREQLADALRIILQWLCAGSRDDHRYSTHLARKCIAALWTLNPAYFDGKSMACLGRERGIDCTRATLSKESVAFQALLKGNLKAKKRKESFNGQ